MSEFKKLTLRQLGFMDLWMETIRENNRVNHKIAQSSIYWGTHIDTTTDFLSLLSMSEELPTFDYNRMTLSHIIDSLVEVNAIIVLDPIKMIYKVTNDMIIHMSTKKTRFERGQDKIFTAVNLKIFRDWVNSTRITGDTIVSYNSFMDSTSDETFREIKESLKGCKEHKKFLKGKSQEFLDKYEDGFLAKMSYSHLRYLVTRLSDAKLLTKYKPKGTRNIYTVTPEFVDVLGRHKIAFAETPVYTYIKPKKKRVKEIELKTEDLDTLIEELMNMRSGNSNKCRIDADNTIIELSFKQ